jgi:NAD(P)-dependent dehydrogenase (short-subunit alcohol dehydrogenase family)
MKTVLITGASRGIGLATAKKFLGDGWRVIGTYNKNLIPITSDQLVSFRLDMSSGESIAQAADKIKKLAIKIDVLVNNAGVALDVADKFADMEKIRKTFEINLFGLIDFTEKLLPIISSGGHIINIDSRYGSFSMPIDDETSIAYRMSKAALNMYTRSLAFRLQKENTIVSSIHPGWVKTDMGYAGITDDGELPDRDADEVADDIYNIVQNVTESGFFWAFGKKHEW